MFKGYFALGGLEVGNSLRSYDYTHTADCVIPWLSDPECPGLRDALGHEPYEAGSYDQTPWFDPDIPELSSRFYGAYIVMMEGLSDSTASANVTEKVGPGARISDVREGSREVRIQLMLTAQGGDALEAGYSWLKTVLSPGACGSHGDACGTTDFAFFLDCPPPREEGETEPDYQARIASYRLYLHDVGRVSGPFTVQEMESQNGIHVGRLVEFTLVAEVPWVFGDPHALTLPPTIPTVIEDVAYNRMPYPGAEVASGTVVVQTNYAQNPSVETDASSWGRNSTVITPASTGARSTALSSVGSASYAVTSTATNASTNGTLEGYLDVDLAASPAIPADARASVSMWAACLRTGTATLGVITIKVQWRTTGGTVLRTDTIDTVPASGGSVSVAGLTIPAGAQVARVIATAALTSWAVGAVITLYCDAVAVTVP